MNAVTFSEAQLQAARDEARNPVAPAWWVGDPRPRDDEEEAALQKLRAVEGAGMHMDKGSPEACGVGASPAPSSRFNRDAARVGSDTFRNPPSPPEQIVESHTLRAVGALIGQGGAGKSTLGLYEAIHIVLARALYGLEIGRPGPVLYLTAEDERDIVRWRLARMAQDMGLSQPEIDHVSANLHIEDCTRFLCRFIDADQGGRLVRTAVLDELVAEYGGACLSAVYVDPQNAFGPGERFVNDGEAELMRAGAWLSQRLNAAVRFTHHTGKVQARAGTSDQYAGRGGSAGADNARFVHVLVTHTADGDGWTAPQGVTPEEIAQGRVLRLHIAKLSHGSKPAYPFWLRRSGFTFEHLRPSATDPEALERDRLRRLYDFLTAQSEAGIRHTSNSLDDRITDVGMTRSELRACLHVARERLHVVECDLPPSERKGARKTYLAPGTRP